FLRVDTPDLLKQARQANATTTTTFTLPDERVQAELVIGQGLLEPCNEVGGGQAKIDAVYRATAGTATFTITPGASMLGQGTLEPDGVTLESDGDTVELGPFVIGPVSIGWLAG